MSKTKMNQFHVMKFQSNHLKDCSYNVEITIEDARKNNEIISIGESQVIRTLFDVVGRKFDKEKLDKLKKEKKLLKLKNRTDLNKDKLIKIDKEIQDIIFISEIVNVQFSNKAHYKKIIRDGLIINGKKYIRFLAGAGNVRVNTVVFIVEELKNEISDVLENGRDKSLELVPAKFNAYFALANSSTIPVAFPRMCVVKDCFIKTERKFDYIPLGKDNLVEENKTVEIELNSFDGQGIISPEMSKVWANNLGLEYVPSGFIIRAPFIKGMVVTFPIHEFSKKVAGTNVIEDAYGDMVDIDDIDLIITESQFKMMSGYKNTQEYVEKCHENNLGFGVSRVSPKVDRSYVRSNYQFLQVLDLDDDEVSKMCKPTIDWLNDLVGEDPEKMLIYLLGSLTNEKISESSFSSLDYITKALMLDRYIASDKYVRTRFLRSIRRKINDSFLGKLIFEGNYSLLISDPYAQAQHVFGMDVTGLLRDEQHYSEFWNKRGVSKVASCRPPLTFQSEVNIMNFQKGTSFDRWYKYINSGTIIPAGGIGVDVVLLADADHDGDIVATFSSPEFVNGKREGLPVVYDKKIAKKKIVDNSYVGLGKVDMQSFNSKIGFITNVASSLYAMECAHDVGSLEQMEIQKRLKLCRKFQGDAIDAGKGIEISPFPDNFVSPMKISDKTTDKEMDFIAISNSIIADKRPYFFKYLYRNYMEKYKKHYEKYNNLCFIKYNISLDDLLSMEERTEDQEKTYQSYYRYSYFTFYPSLMNRVCWHMEYHLPEIRKNVGSCDINFMIYMNRNMPVSDEDVEKMMNLFNEYKRHKTELYETNDKFNSSFEDIQHFIEYIRSEAFGISNNVRYLANLAVHICYRLYPNGSSEFAWKVFGDGMLENIISNKRRNGEDSVFIPMKSDNGSIEYLFDNYELMEYSLDDIN